MDVVGEVRVEAAGDRTAIVALQGEHDLGTVPQVREAFESAAEAGQRLIIDLSGATFVDSSILGAILEARRRAGEGGTGFAVASSGAAEPVRRVLDVTGLAEELPVHADRDAALAALDAQGPS